MFLGLETEYQDFQNQFSAYCESYFLNRQSNDKGLDILWHSIRYSFDSGGKRFRPFLTYLVSKVYSEDLKKFLPLALAVEMIHTYSLIHDDLPCMDNDDFRRGQPTNHKKFGEDIALLAGDALLTEAFRCLANDTLNSAELKIAVIQIFSDLIGSNGMVGGQVLDMKSTTQITIEQLENIHHKKTGDLISAAILGAAIICKTHDFSGMQNFSKNLGLAFQIKDDLLDGLDGAQDHKSYLKILGLKKAEEKLLHHSSVAEKSLLNISLKTDLLKKIVQFNLARDK